MKVDGVTTNEICEGTTDFFRLARTVMWILTHTEAIWLDSSCNDDTLN